MSELMNSIIGFDSRVAAPNTLRSAFSGRALCSSDAIIIFHLDARRPPRATRARATPSSRDNKWSQRSERRFSDYCTNWIIINDVRRRKKWACRFFGAARGAPRGEENRRKRKNLFDLCSHVSAQTCIVCNTLRSSEHTESINNLHSGSRRLARRRRFGSGRFDKTSEERGKRESVTTTCANTKRAVAAHEAEVHSSEEKKRRKWPIVFPWLGSGAGSGAR